MNRRRFLAAAAAAAAPLDARTRIVIPLHRMVDTRAKLSIDAQRPFWFGIWPEAVRDLGRAGIHLDATDANGEIRRSPGDRPVFTQLRRNALNLVVTSQVPLLWDNAKGLAGVTGVYEGFHLCVIAMRYAHRHQVPFLSVNTCVHELLHAFMGDILVRRPEGFEASTRELRIDALATRLWLFGDGAAIRDSAAQYLKRSRL